MMQSKMFFVFSLKKEGKNKWVFLLFRKHFFLNPARYVFKSKVILSQYHSLGSDQLRS